MNQSKFIEIFKNITAGPLSTLMGVIFFVGGGYMVYSTYNSENVIAWTSFEVALLGAGCLLLIKSDEWLKSLISKKKDGESK